MTSGARGVTLRDATGKRLDLDICHACDQSCLNDEVRSSASLAEQDLAGVLLPLRVTPKRQAVRVLDLPRAQLHATGGAVTRLAAMRKVEPRAQRALQNRPISSHADAASVGLHQDGVFTLRHVSQTTAGAAAVAATKNPGSARPVPRSLTSTMFRNPPADKIKELLRSARIIAVVGLSDDPSRPSHHVAEELQRFGYRIIPVTPKGGTILGEQAVPDLDHLGDVLKPGEKVDVVDVFRRPEHVAAIVEDCIRLRLPALWLQDGVVDEAAAEKAVNAGIFTVMDRCMFRDRAALR